MNLKLDTYRTKRCVRNMDAYRDHYVNLTYILCRHPNNKRMFWYQCSSMREAGPPWGLILKGWFSKPLTSSQQEAVDLTLDVVSSLVSGGQYLNLKSQPVKFEALSPKHNKLNPTIEAPCPTQKNPAPKPPALSPKAPKKWTTKKAQRPKTDCGKVLQLRERSR